MVDVLLPEDVASLLQLPHTEGLSLLVEKTNELVTEHWTDAAEATQPYPVRVWSVAYNIVARAAVNPRGASSETRSWDDVQRTIRFEGAALDRLGLYITAEEIDELNGVATDDPPFSIGTISTPVRSAVPTRRAWDAQC